MYLDLHKEHQVKGFVIFLTAILLVIAIPIYSYGTSEAALQATAQVALQGAAQENSQVASQGTYQGANYDQFAANNIVSQIDSYMGSYLGKNQLTNYMNGKAVLCHAMVNYVWKNVLGEDLYSGKSSITPASTDYANMGNYMATYARPGDILRVDRKHSLVITSFDANTVTGYEWLYTKKETKTTYTWAGVKAWGNGSQSYWLYQINDDIYNSFGNGSGADSPNRGNYERSPEAFGTMSFQIDNNIMTVNGKEKNIDSMGTKPMLINNSSYLPVRSVIEGMGGGVAWNNDTRVMSICYNGHFIYLTMDSDVMVVNDRNVKISNAPTIVGGRTMIPVRPIVESLGGILEWDDSTKKISIYFPKPITQ